MHHILNNCTVNILYVYYLRFFETHYFHFALKTDNRVLGQNSINRLIAV